MKANTLNLVIINKLGSFEIWVYGSVKDILCETITNIEVFNRTTGNAWGGIWYPPAHNSKKDLGQKKHW